MAAKFPKPESCKIANPKRVTKLLLQKLVKTCRCNSWSKPAAARLEKSLKSQKLNHQLLTGKSHKLKQILNGDSSKPPKLQTKMNQTNNSKTLKVNGELSCAAAALLEKPVRVGVSLGDLLDQFLINNKNAQIIKQLTGKDKTLPCQNTKIRKLQNSNELPNYFCNCWRKPDFPKPGEWLPLLMLEKFRAAKLPKPENWKITNPE